MYKAKHLPLLALALLVSSTELRAEDFPFKVGDSVGVFFSGEKAGELKFKITNIKGKWFEGQATNHMSVPLGLMWANSDQVIYIYSLAK